MSTRLLEMQKMESLGVLAGSIAHDFNNLLTAILGNAQLAKLQNAGDARLAKQLEAIESASLQAAGLCKQMLAYGGRGKMETERLDLNQLLREMTPLLNISAHNRTKSVQLHYELAETLPAVQANVSQVRQVLLNLVINAADAIGETEGNIRITTGARDRNQDQNRERVVFVKITDTGCGMDATTQARIFEPFFTTKQSGHGLGLAAVQGIMRAHGGSLELQSAVGKGSVFTLRFPAAAALREPEKRGLVLVADDNEGMRALTAAMLESCHYGALIVSDGRQAVETYAARQEEISAVLLDLRMPTLDGAAAVGEIRAINQEVPLLLMSGYPREEALRGVEGDVRFLKKPFTLEELEAALTPREEMRADTSRAMKHV